MSRLDDFKELARTRRSVRRFSDEPVGTELVMDLLDPARWAPSPQNRQGWRFAVISDREALDRLADSVAGRWREISAGGDSGVREEVEGYAGNFTWFRRAPAAVIFFSKRPESFMAHMLKDDATSVSGSATAAAMAAQNFLLAAHAAGLGSCVITGALVAREEMLDLAGLGRRWDPVCLVALGRPSDVPEPPKRIPLEEVTIII